LSLRGWEGGGGETRGGGGGRRNQNTPGKKKTFNLKIESLVYENWNVSFKEIKLGSRGGSSAQANDEIEKKKSSSSAASNRVWKKAWLLGEGPKARKESKARSGGGKDRGKGAQRTRN